MRLIDVLFVMVGLVTVLTGLLNPESRLMLLDLELGFYILCVIKFVLAQVRLIIVAELPLLFNDSSLKALPLR